MEVVSDMSHDKEKIDKDKEQDGQQDESTAPQTYDGTDPGPGDGGEGGQTTGPGK